MKRIVLGLFLLLPLVGCKKEKIDEKMEVSGITGTVKNYLSFKSNYVDARNVDVWLPDSYGKAENKRYAVIYMHDGQNLFDPNKSYIGVDWGIDESITRLIDEKKIKETIVVGIWNTEKRYDEYMPQKAVEHFCTKEQIDAFKAERSFSESCSDNYLKFIVEELKPFIDSTYKTFPEKENTFIMGSSMGGLISAYAICEYPQVFGGAGCLSTHWTAGGGCILSYMEKKLPSVEDHKIYFDFGTETIDAEYEPFQVRMDKLMEKSGFKFGKNWITKKFKGADHSERAWRKRVHIPIEFFLEVKQ